ncbi:MAG: hypothetical protein ACRDE7_13230, partial [Sphingobacterium sp.]
ILSACLLLLYTISSAQSLTKTKLYILGVVHDSASVLTPQMLFKILEDIKPEVILQENDSEQIANYDQIIRSSSNEQTATLKYLKAYPKTLNLPFEFEGRNQYRKDHGMVPTDNLTIRLLDSLYQENLLSDVNRKIYDKYKEATTALINFSKRDIKALNSIEFEATNRYRQNLQHHELPKIVNSQDIFTKRFVTKPDGTLISYRDGYQLWCNFWDLRNNSMAINIIKKANENKGKRMVILTGVQHKYYLKELLERYADGSYEVIEYFK